MLMNEREIPQISPSALVLRAAYPRKSFYWCDQFYWRSSQLFWRK